MNRPARHGHADFKHAHGRYFSQRGRKVSAQAGPQSASQAGFCMRWQSGGAIQFLGALQA